MISNSLTTSRALRWAMANSHLPARITSSRARILLRDSTTHRSNKRRRDLVSSRRAWPVWRVAAAWTSCSKRTRPINTTIKQRQKTKKQEMEILSARWRKVNLYVCRAAWGGGAPMRFSRSLHADHHLQDTMQTGEFDKRRSRARHTVLLLRACGGETGRIAVLHISTRKQ